MDCPAHSQQGLDADHLKFSCVEKHCPRLSASMSGRTNHLQRTHYYPPDFNFRVMESGIDEEKPTVFIDNPYFRQQRLRRAVQS